jgi:hypothetical protein
MVTIIGFAAHYIFNDNFLYPFMLSFHLIANCIIILL